MYARRRPVAAWLLVVFVSSLLAPALPAQGTASQDDQSFAAQVEEALVTRDRVAQGYQDQRARRDAALKAAQELRAMTAPAGVDARAWDRLVSGRAAELEAWARENDALAQRSADRLGQYQRELQGYQERIESSGSSQERDLKGLLGTALKEPLFPAAKPTANSPQQYDGLSLSLGNQATAYTQDPAKGNVLNSFAQSYGSDLVRQLGQNGWNPAKVDFGRKLEAMGKPQFWGGVAGAFAGGMAGGALAATVPGGSAVATVLRFALATSGAAVGCQLGTGGSLKDIDWTRFWITTAGAMAGKLAFAFLGPFGAWAGAFVGGVLADWALRVWRQWAAQPHQAGERPAEGAAGREPWPQQGTSTDANAYQPSADEAGASGSAVELAGMRDELVQELLAAMQAPRPDQTRIRELQGQLSAVDRALAQQRTGGLR